MSQSQFNTRICATLMEVLGAYIQQDLEATPRQRNHSRKRLNNQVADGSVFLEVQEQRVHRVPHQDFLPCALVVLPLSVFELRFHLFRLDDKAVEDITLGPEIKIESFSVLRF